MKMSFAVQEPGLGAGDLEILRDARMANPAWFEAIMLAAEIMATRRKKWSGKTNPYSNFIRWAQMNQAGVEQTFMWATTLKLTRDQDAEAIDDSLIDNAVDGINYPALKAGWLLMPAADKMACMLELGVWIDHRLLASWELRKNETLSEVPTDQEAAEG